MPVGNIPVGNTGGNVKHDDSTLSLNVISITQATELLLTSGIPYVEADGTIVGRESQRMDFDA